MKTIKFLILFLISMTAFVAAEVVADEQLGYSIFLPGNWVKETVSGTQHRFEDTSGTYQSMIVIVRYDFSTDTVFETSQDWTRANFIAYSFSIDADPFSILVFYDTVTARQNETLWAADAFSQFFSIDTTLGDWAEYIRFTASGTYGYEIYAIGPAEDMAANVGYYVAIIEGITLPTNEVTVSRQNRGVRPAVLSASGASFHTLNLLGRVVRAERRGIPVSNMVITHRSGSGMVSTVKIR
jgi:hypothetical protein